jgi:N-methylhydantoinase A
VAPAPAPQPAGLRLIFDGRAEKKVEVPLYRREAMAPGARIGGPALIAEDETTTFISASFDAHIDGSGCIVMERKAA